VKLQALNACFPNGDSSGPNESRNKRLCTVRLYPPLSVKICPVLKSRGACSDTSCRTRHDVHICEDCGVVCPSLAIFKPTLAAASYKPDIGGENYLRCMCARLTFCPKSGLSMCPALVIAKTSRQGLSATIDLKRLLQHLERILRSLQEFVSRTIWTTAYANEKTQAKGSLLPQRDTEEGKNKHGVTVSDGLIFGIMTSECADRHSCAVHMNHCPASRIRVF